ncbi:MAG: DUF4292 domain-containing protein [Bacteroidales bacterium]|nr:DUF4292 domain-containing protein [Bacteroidales bacterium]
MKKNNYFWLFIFSVNMIVLLTSCKIFKKTSNIPSQSQEQIEQKTVHHHTDSIFKKLERNYLNFTTMSAKFSCTFTDDKKDKTTFSGSLRIRANQLVWVSINTLLNIEFARILLRPDSVFFIDRVGKFYFSGDYLNVSQLFFINMDFDMIYSLLLNKDFSYYETSFFKIMRDENHLRLSTPARTKIKKYVKKREDLERIYMQDIWIDTTYWKIRKQRIKEISNPNQTFTLEYNDFRSIDHNILFPYEYNIEILSDKKFTLSIILEKVSLNDSIITNFRIPSDYKNFLEKK